MTTTTFTTTTYQDLPGVELLGRYDRYDEAQATVDVLADRGFPVRHVTVVGEDLRVVEQVTGRMTVARAAGLGALQGTWIGLVFALVLGIVVPLTWLGFVLAVLLPIAGAAAWSAGMHAATHGRRDFSSERRIEAGRYAVLVTAAEAAAARTTLQPW